MRGSRPYPLLEDHRVKILSAFFVGSMLAAVSFGSAHAQTPTSKEFSGSVFAGVGATSDYEGSENLTAIPFVGFRLQYGAYYLQSRGLGVQANVIPSKRLDAGPIINYRGPRDDVENTAVDTLEDIDGALEFGAFGTYNMQPGFRNGDSAGIGVSILRDVSDAHDGLLTSFSANYGAPINQRMFISLDTSLTYASEEYMQTYFGVTAAGSTASGLQQYAPEGGFKDLSLGINLRYAFNQSWGLIGRAQYTRLLGEAADSPIVDEQGNPNNFLVGTGVSYRF